MTTPLFLLRCLQIGLSLRDLDLLTVGMVNDIFVENMNDDYYYFDEVNVMLTGKHSNKVYKIGDKIKVKVISADKFLRRIDFEVV